MRSGWRLSGGDRVRVFGILLINYLFSVSCYVTRFTDPIFQAS
jgi:hypothetical protein